MASHLHQGSQRLGLVGIHRQRSAARRRYALPHARQISLARDADAVSVLGGRHRPRGCGRDGDEDGEVDHRAMAGTGAMNWVVDPALGKNRTLQEAPNRCLLGGAPDQSKKADRAWKVSQISAALEKLSQTFAGYPEKARAK